MSWVKFKLLLIALISSLFRVKSQSACKNVSHPHAGSDCYNRNDEKYSCCFATLDFANHTSTTTCFPIEKNFEFVGSFLTKYDLGNQTYANATVSCKSDPQKTCGTDRPHELGDCRYNGSNSTSCCMIVDNTGHGNCILSKYKFWVETNYSIFNNTIQCSGMYLTFSKLLTFVLFLILSI